MLNLVFPPAAYPANNERFQNHSIFGFFKNVYNKRFENAFKMFGIKCYVLKTSYKMFYEMFYRKHSRVTFY